MDRVLVNQGARGRLASDSLKDFSNLALASLSSQFKRNQLAGVAVGIPDGRSAPSFRYLQRSHL